MYEERETFEPANLSILAMRSPERVRDVFVFILPLYYQGRIPATGGWSTSWGGVDVYRKATSRLPVFRYLPGFRGDPAFVIAGLVSRDIS